jgi:hypothetical protein
MSRRSRHGRSPHPHPAARPARPSGPAPERSPAPATEIRPDVAQPAPLRVAVSRPTMPATPAAADPLADSAPGAAFASTPLVVTTLDSTPLGAAVPTSTGPAPAAGNGGVAPGATPDDRHRERERDRDLEREHLRPVPALRVAAMSAAPVSAAPVPASPMPAQAVLRGPDEGNGTGPDGARPTCTVAQLRRFIKSRPWVPMHELRRRFGIFSSDDDVTPIQVGDQRLYIGLPGPEGRLMAELLGGGDVGYELSLDPGAPIVVGVYPMRPVPRA